MDSFEFNKIAGAVLATALGIMAVSIIGDMIYAPHEAEEPGFEVAVAESGEGAGEAQPSGGGEVAPIAARLQTADASAGENDAKICLACHSLGKGEPAKVGPNLYGVVGGPMGHEADFSYSAGMKANHEAGKEWSYANLDHFLTSPSDFVPGTAMGFAGIKDPGKRADVIAYLRTLSDSPPPLPPPEGGAGGAMGAPPPPPGGPAPDQQMAAAGPSSPPPGGADHALAERLQAASADTGKSDARICMACHTFDEGGGTRVGPNLYGVVDRPVAHEEGFSYSQAMADKGASGAEWTFANLDHFLTSPQDFVPGTAMGFAGFADAAKRADVIAYLRTLSNSPVPLPDDQAMGAPSPPPSGPAPDQQMAQTPPPEPPPPPAGGGNSELDQRLQAASADTGKSDARICMACHTFDEGGGTRVGPNLYGIVDRPVAHEEGFSYSQAMADKGSEGMDWTFANLDQFLTSPQDFIPGTAMGFAGFADAAKRADVIAYLRTLSNSPVPLPGGAPQHSTELPPPAPQQ